MLVFRGPDFHQPEVQAFPEKAMSKLEDYGFIQSRPKGEYHANNQQMSKLLHKAVGLGGKGAAPQVGTAWVKHSGPSGTHVCLGKFVEGGRVGGMLLARDWSLSPSCNGSSGGILQVTHTVFNNAASDAAPHPS